MGGMGTLASESFVHLLNQWTKADSDQTYFNYVLFNHATVPDRTAYIEDQSQVNPLPYLLQDIALQNQIGAKFIVLTCNTAHYFYEALQEKSAAPILHMPKIAVTEVKEKYHGETVAFLGTTGSILAGVYENEIKKAGFTYWLPDKTLQEKINFLIYHQIKAKSFFDFTLYDEILLDVAQQTNNAAVVLGCTELSLLEEKRQTHGQNIFDAQALTVLETIRQAENLRR